MNMNTAVYKTNFVIDGDIDFYKALAESDDEQEINSSTDELCLISQKPIDENAITLLVCKHTFNYHALYKEIVKQKYKRYNTSTYDKTILMLKINEFLCPYCRTKQESLLPYVKDTSISLIRGVNSPALYCMPYHTCSYIFKSGKSKGNCCHKNALSINGIKLCSIHIKYTILSKPKHDNTGCCAILKSGPNKGISCGMKIRNITTSTCLRHSPLSPISESPIIETPTYETSDIEPYKEVDITTFLESLMKIT